MTRYEARSGADDYEDGSDATGRPVGAPRRPRAPRAAPKMRLGSDGERALETHLRQVGLRDYRREFRFHPVREWRFDFAFPDAVGGPLAVEVEGGTWSTGRHTRGDGFEEDCLKYAEAAILGWRVIRVTTDMVEDGRAVALLERALR